MPHRFPDKPAFTGLNTPCRIEAVINDLEYEGEMPAGLRGTFYRCGPDPRFPPLLGDDININGDGMVTMFRLGEGHVDFRSRYVRTEKYELESKAHRALFGMYRNPYTSDPSVTGRDGTTANTSIVFHAGRLFALKEDGLPHELDPDTLETRGKHRFEGKLRSLTCTAHPKIDPRTGELLSHGYEARGLATRDVSLQVVSRSGELVREDFFLAPWVSFMHDWAVTDRHFVFPVTPTTADDARMRKGGAHWMYQPGVDAMFGLMRRDADVQDLRWYRVPDCSQGHVLNAFSEGDTVYVDILVSERNQFPFIENADGSPFDRNRAVPRLTRFAFDLAKAGEHYSAEVLYPDFMELPILDSRYALNPYRYGFAAILDRSRPLNVAGTIGFGWNTLAKVDLATRRIQRYYVGDGNAAGEPCFVPRSRQAAEGDGYLLSVLTCYGRVPHSRLIVLDTQDIEQGPVASVQLPVRLRGAVHGFWVDETALAAVPRLDTGLNLGGAR
jgi:carotenoid cleavage dioxygenase-like enzyme